MASSSDWNENEPRWAGFALMSGGPSQPVAMCATYLVAVTVFGPYMMRGRKPVGGLVWPIRAYNAFMVAFNLYLYVGFSRKTRWGADAWACPRNARHLDHASLVLWELTLVSRYCDFFDSLFFVLRRKFSHLSVLHVVHHASVPLIVWYAGKCRPSPANLFAGYINLPIHVVMYTYYCLSTFPRLRRFLWWKKYITWIQIGQFLLDFAHALYLELKPSCRPDKITHVQTVASLMFLFMFVDFYLKSYKSRRNSSQPDANQLSARKLE